MKHSSTNILFLILSVVILASSCTKKDVDIDLTTNAWKVEKIRKSGKLIYTDTDSTYVLRFSSDETYNLNLDVNTCIRLYDIPHKGSIDFQGMACTKICCDSEFAEDLSSLFPKMTSYYMRENTLHLEGEGEIILQPN